MIPVTCASGKTIAVFGLGLSGLITARALIEGGASVVCWDDGETGRQKALDAGLPVQDLRDADWSKFDSLLLAPGVPFTHPEPHWTVQRAQAAGVEVIGDTELFVREHQALGSKARIIGLTGTNGKSTTTALVSHLLTSAGFDVQMGGNIGKAVLDLEPFADERVYVIEFSSYQIDITPGLELDGAALLNLTRDHIDRHGTIENYAAVKERIFQRMSAGATAVVGVDDGYCQAIASRLDASLDVTPVSVTRELADGVFARDGVVYEACRGQVRELFLLRDAGSLRGAHNWQNACIAGTLARGVGADLGDIQRGLNSFPGLEHRMQEIARVGDVLYVNDSKATNADAAEKALSSFDRIYWIAGGVAKEGGIEGLEVYFPRITKAYLIGEAAEDFGRVLDGKAEYVISGTIEEAVLAATRDAMSASDGEKVVLLSPACASFDQYANFMLRGDAFSKAVEKLSA